MGISAICKTHILGGGISSIKSRKTHYVTAWELSQADEWNKHNGKKLRGFPVMCLLCIIWYQTTPTRIASNPSEKSLEGVYTFIFYAFFIKKRRQGECRSFSFSVIPPTSFAYILIIIHTNTESTGSVPLFKLSHRGLHWLLSVLLY